METFRLQPNILILQYKGLLNPSIRKISNLSRLRFEILYSSLRRDIFMSAVALCVFFLGRIRLGGGEGGGEDHCCQVAENLVGLKNIFFPNYLKLLIWLCRFFSVFCRIMLSNWQRNLGETWQQWKGTYWDSTNRRELPAPFLSHPEVAAILEYRMPNSSITLYSSITLNPSIVEIQSKSFRLWAMNCPLLIILVSK